MTTTKIIPVPVFEQEVNKANQPTGLARGCEATQHVNGETYISMTVQSHNPKTHDTTIVVRIGGTTMYLDKSSAERLLYMLRDCRDWLGQRTFFGERVENYTVKYKEEV